MVQFYLISRLFMLIPNQSIILLDVSLTNQKSFLMRAVASTLLQYHLELSQSTYNHHTTHENEEGYGL